GWTQGEAPCAARQVVYHPQSQAAERRRQPAAESNQVRAQYLLKVDERPDAAQDQTRDSGDEKSPLPLSKRVHGGAPLLFRRRAFSFSERTSARRARWLNCRARIYAMIAQRSAGAIWSP